MRRSSPVGSSPTNVPLSSAQTTLRGRVGCLASLPSALPMRREFQNCMGNRSEEKYDHTAPRVRCSAAIPHRQYRTRNDGNRFRASGCPSIVYSGCRTMAVPTAPNENGTLPLVIATSRQYSIQPRSHWMSAHNKKLRRGLRRCSAGTKYTRFVSILLV